uniref:Enoyl-CoA hydratase domain containing 2 n=1 Tax=Leptobrachium leishanense TaxID=445787 RepID=A0A8C5R7Z2_9ANUR
MASLARRLLGVRMAVPGLWRGHSSATGGKEVHCALLEGSNAGIAEIVLCRPHARNSLGRLFVTEFFHTVDILRHDSSVRVVVVRSAIQGVFCAGADLKERAKMDNNEASLFVNRLRGLMSEIESLPMPTIAAVDGYALGGGLELAMACDLRIAASSAKLGLIETTRGLLPGAGGSQRLPRLVGMGIAKELIYTGRQIDGAQAQIIGLVNDAVTQNEAGDAAYKRALELAQEILPQAPVAVRMAKVAMNKGSEVDLASGMAIEGLCYGQVIPTKDRQEGMLAFIEKRKPQYKGE